MQVICNKGHEGLLVEGNTYTVIGITYKGNYILKEVEIPEGFTSFDKDRFQVFDIVVDDWSEEMEESYWAEQPTI